MSLILHVAECPNFYEEQGLPQEITCSSGSLGRDSSNDIVLPDPECLISGRHALIEFNGQGYILKDISTNGTFINDEGSPIGVGLGVVIESGDRIRIGDYVLEARFDHTVIEHADASDPTRKLPTLDGDESDADIHRAISSAGPMEVSDSEQAKAWRTLLASAGLDASEANLDELGTELGLTIKAVTRGLMQILKTRTDIKEEFGVPLTRMRRTENNPLKFSVTPEEALENLFIKEGSSYMRGTDTYVDSLDDFRIHEIATMAAIRAAVDHMQTQFDPQALKKQFQSGDTRKLFMERLKKGEYWDQYEKWFAELSEDEQYFSNIFGKAFARAYDEKVHRLVSMKRGHTQADMKKPEDG